MKHSRFVVPLLLASVLCAPALLCPALASAARAAEASAPEETTPAATPPEARAAMAPGGISLRYETLPPDAQGRRAGLHLYVNPAGRAEPNAYSGNYVPRPGSPITRPEIRPGAGSGIIDSPFTLDVFLPTGSKKTGGRLRRVNSVRFIESRDVDRIIPLFLQPRLRLGRIVALSFSALGTYNVVAITFPHGLEAAASVDRFYGGGMGGGGTQLRFDRLDSRGFLTFENVPYSPNFGDVYRLYLWDGRHFRLQTPSHQPSNRSAFRLFPTSPAP